MQMCKYSLEKRCECDFQWLSQEEMDSAYIIWIPNSSSADYILECDKIYSHEMHYEHSNYLFISEMM